ncbi:MULTISPECIES: hypothetical protein [unclassified Dyella]|uniref:hypothetical protein n=1 Tax=unclassified Dyella TaxID=2634549 RepID=UPI003F8FECCB
MSDKVETCDLVMVKVVGAPKPQTFRAKVQRIYAARKGIQVTDLGAEIEFVGSPNHWGQVALALGDEALLFVRSVSGRLYEDSWHGHMVLERIDGILYAIYQKRELWLGESVPASIKSCARQDPERPYATAICFDALEDYLTSLITKTDGAL